MDDPTEITASLYWATNLKKAGWPQPAIGEAPFWFWYGGKLWNMTGQETDSGCYGPCWGHKRIENEAGEKRYEEGYIEDWSFGEDFGEEREVHHSLVYVAPTAEEIIRKLPKEIQADEGECTLRIFFPTQYGNVASYEFHTLIGPTIGTISGNQMIFHDKNTLANASAAMYCCLSEHNLLPKEA